MKNNLSKSKDLTLDAVLKERYALATLKSFGIGVLTNIIMIIGASIVTGLSTGIPFYFIGGLFGGNGVNICVFLIMIAISAVISAVFSCNQPDVDSWRKWRSLLSQEAHEKFAITSSSVHFASEKYSALDNAICRCKSYKEALKNLRANNLSVDHIPVREGSYFSGLYPILESFFSEYVQRFEKYLPKDKEAEIEKEPLKESSSHYPFEGYKSLMSIISQIENNCHFYIHYSDGRSLEVEDPALIRRVWKYATDEINKIDAEIAAAII